MIFHPYIISVYNVVGDGNCGFRCVAHGICENQNRWREVRQMLLQELELHREVYTSMFTKFGFDGICYSVNWFEYGSAPEDRYMEMSDTGLVIASSINRPVVLISQRGWNTCFPLFDGPNLSQ